MKKVSRPKYLGLFTLAANMSITAKASILHRVSGVLLFLSIPILLFILHCSLTAPDFYNTLYGVMVNPVIKLLYLLLIWAFIYHLCAGVRFLFLDIDIGAEIISAKKTSYLVIFLSIILTATLGVIIW